MHEAQLSTHVTDRATIRGPSVVTRSHPVGFIPGMLLPWIIFFIANALGHSIGFGTLAARQFFVPFTLTTPKIDHPQTHLGRHPLHRSADTGHQTLLLEWSSQTPLRLLPQHVNLEQRAVQERQDPKGNLLAAGVSSKAKQSRDGPATCQHLLRVCSAIVLQGDRTGKHTHQIFAVSLKL